MDNSASTCSKEQILRPNSARTTVHDTPCEGTNFQQWLTSVAGQFKSFSNDERNNFLDHLIEVSDSSQLYHLSEKLDRLLKRNFIVQLPREQAFYLLGYLDPQSLLTSCRVCRAWNEVITSCTAVWKQSCSRLGVSIPDSAPMDDPTFYKRLYLRVKRRLHSLHRGTAFDVQVYHGHTDRVMAVAYWDGKLATGSDDRTVRIWDCDTGHCIKTLQTHTVADLKFDNDRVVTASFDTNAACWDMEDGHMICQYVGHVAAVFSVDYNAERGLLISGSADSTVKVWSLLEGELLRTLSQHRSAWITQVCLHCNPDNGDYFILSRDNLSVHMWRMNTEHDIVHTEEWQNPHNDLVPGIQVEGPSVSFATMDTFNTCYVAQTSLTGMSTIQPRVSYEVPRDAYVLAFLGSGRQYDVLLLEGESPSIDVVRHTSPQLITSLTLPSDYRPSKRGSTFAIGEYSWLHGFNTHNDAGVFFATSLRDNSIFVLKWRPLKCDNDNNTQKSRDTAGVDSTLEEIGSTLMKLVMLINQVDIK